MEPALTISADVPGPIGLDLETYSVNHANGDKALSPRQGHIRPVSLCDGNSSVHTADLRVARCRTGSRTSSPRRLSQQSTTAASTSLSLPMPDCRCPHTNLLHLERRQALVQWTQH